MTAVAIVVAVLAVHNVAGNVLVPSSWYVPVNLGVAVGLVSLALVSHLSDAELGLDPSAAPAGVAAGGAVALVVAAALLVAVLLPPTRPLLADQRVAGVGPAELAYRALVRIPLGTVVLEEVGFRGVLLGLLMRETSSGRAVAVSSALFGLWHILPTLGALGVNDLASTPAGRLGAVAAAVAVTAAAGVGFCWLRLRTGSLLAPALAHTATNSLATVAAYVVLRLR